jgi:hypothetical protein
MKLRVAFFQGCCIEHGWPAVCLEYEFKIFGAKGPEEDFCDLTGDVCC